MRNMAPQLLSRCIAALCFLALAASTASADPVITGFNNNHGPVGSSIIIYGSGFGDFQGGSYVLLGDRMVPTLAWTPVAIYMLVDPLAFGQGPVALDTVYPVQVITEPGDKHSNTLDFTLTSGTPPVVTPPSVPAPPDQPSIQSFNSPRLCDGSFLTIYGSGFGQTRGGGYVTITVPLLDSQGQPFTQEYLVPVLGWSENAISAWLGFPTGAQPGSYTATVHRDNGKTASGSFTVAACPPS
jgi:IPT/TIG domain-containing protein